MLKTNNQARACVGVKAAPPICGSSTRTLRGFTFLPRAASHRCWRPPDWTARHGRTPRDRVCRSSGSCRYLRRSQWPCPPPCCRCPATSGLHHHHPQVVTAPAAGGTGAAAGVAGTRLPRAPRQPASDLLSAGWEGDCTAPSRSDALELMQLRVRTIPAGAGGRRRRRHWHAA